MWKKVEIKQVFRGINIVNLDEKGRLAVPAKYRAPIQQEAGSHLIITIDTEEDCLLLYPLPAWKIIEQKIEALPSFNPATRRIQRLLIGHATELEMDKSGRILLPGLLREYAKLEKRVMLIGQGKKFELWDEATWNGKRSAWLQQELQAELPEQLTDISL